MSASPVNAGPAKSGPDPKRKIVAANSAQELPWTGERLVPSARGDFVAEHLHRYALATDIAAGLDVMDVACGEGYGSAFVASVAKSVIGVDSDTETISHAARKYRASNLRFVVGKAEKIPLPDASIDLVVSFETLEHLDDHDAMLREIKRLLRPRGRLLISTPDATPYQQVSGRTNPFHIRELDRKGFHSLLSRHFKHVAFGQQKSISGSWFVPAMANAASTTEYSGGFARIERVAPGEGAPYVVALASDGTVPPMPASFYNAAQEIAATYDTLVSEHRDSMAALVRLEAEFAERTAWSRSLETDIVKARAEAGRLQNEAIELKNWARVLEGDVRKARELVIERTKLAEKQTAWAQSLESELRKTETHFARVSAELAERTAWAQSLERNLAEERSIAAERDREIAARTEWAKSLEQDIARERSIVAERDREIATHIAWANSLERDLTEERSIVAERDREIAARTEWAQSLEQDIARERSIVAERDREIATHIAWANSLERDLAEERSIAVERDREIAARTEWAKSLEQDIARERSIVAERDREIAARTEWAQSLEHDLAESHQVVAQRDELLEERTGWIRTLEQELSRMRFEVERLQQVHHETIDWGRSLEAQVVTGQQDFARLNGEFADRTQWALSLDAELTATKNDRDRISSETQSAVREMEAVREACQRMAPLLGGVASGASAAAMTDGATRLIAAQRLELAEKDHQLRAVRAGERHADLNRAAVETESRRLAAALSDAQVHLDNLLGQTGKLQETLNDREISRVTGDQVHRQTERELALRTLEARHFGAALSGYEKLFVCRLLYRWFGGNPSAMHSETRSA